MKFTLSGGGAISPDVQVQGLMFKVMQAEGGRGRKTQMTWRMRVERVEGALKTFPEWQEWVRAAFGCPLVQGYGR